ncbi:3-oxoacyl-synth [Westerdykella ornata]|uniref:beta-ketoacyl-[acyl-carrier-protein] synthase I n=1 Tax=Westerdykella ornata TaxID=318751 RepID=A0A6A6JN42_WESOR|nr:3-oxoacyl-synth [Westerdykella ornata]KAF2277922.1 3-oxoacyl-synth [Westerdykella ornata]
MRKVVVTGLGLVTPLGIGVRRAWQRLLDGECGIVSIAERGERFAALPSRVAGVVPEGARGEGRWNAAEWLRVGDERKMARFAQYAMVASEEALQDAGWSPKAEGELEATGVYMGSGIGSLDDVYDTSVAYENGGYRKVSPLFVPRLLINLAAGHVSMRFGFKGPNHAATTACTTGAHSIGDAARLIQFGDADVMIAGGSESCIHPLAIAGFARARGLATDWNDRPKEASRPFNRDRAGFVIGEGAGVMVLEELEHAKNRGAKIYAHVAGYGLSSDAYHMTAPREDGHGPYLAMKHALRHAGIKPSDVDYVNAHATSTPLGDAAENRAIKRLLLGEEGKSKAADVNISSTKGAVGHLLGAAGSVEAIFTVLGLHHNVLPPTLNLDNPGDPPEDFDCNYVAKVAQEKEIPCKSLQATPPSKLEITRISRDHRNDTPPPAQLACLCRCLDFTYIQRPSPIATFLIVAVHVEDGKPSLIDSLSNKASTYHSRVPYLRKLPFPAIAIIVTLILVNVVVWAVVGVVLHFHTPLLSTALLSYTLGLRHALDADHISAIDLMTRRLIASGQRPVSVGLFFSLGHSTIVIVTSLVVAGTAAAVSSRFDDFERVGGIVGTSVSAAFLTLLGIVNMWILYKLVQQMRRLLLAAEPGSEEQAQQEQGQRQEQEGMHFEGAGVLYHLFHKLFTLIDRPWKMYPLGILFGLGFDTSSEIAILGISSIHAARGTSIWLILVFPVLFTAGMALLDTADGALMMALYTSTQLARDKIAVCYYSIVLTGVTVVVAVAIGVVQFLNLALNVVQPDTDTAGGGGGHGGAFWRGVERLGERWDVVGGAICGAFVLVGGVSVVVYGPWRRRVERGWERKRRRRGEMLGDESEDVEGWRGEAEDGGGDGDGKERDRKINVRPLEREGDTGPVAGRSGIYYYPSNSSIPFPSLALNPIPRFIYELLMLDALSALGTKYAAR